MKIKKGDHVLVIAGKDRGRVGEVILVDPDKQKILVHSVNMIKKNKKVDYQGRRGAKEGGIMHTEGLIHVSNVQVIDPETKKPSRVGYKRGDGDRKVRITRASGKEI